MGVVRCNCNMSAERERSGFVLIGEIIGWVWLLLGTAFLSSSYFEYYRSTCSGSRAVLFCRKKSASCHKESPLCSSRRCLRPFCRASTDW